MVQRKDYVKDNMIYDPLTGNIWWSKSCGKRRLDRPIGSLDGRGYLQVMTPHGNLKLHRIAWFLYYEFWPLGKHIDHVNGVKTDNRILNLRLATNKQNLLNSKSHRDNLYSHYKGVSFDKRASKWIARFSNKYLGSFNTELEAAECYNKHVDGLGNAFTRGNEIP